MIAVQTAGAGAAIARMDRSGSLRTLDGGRSWRRFHWRFAASFATPGTVIAFLDPGALTSW